MTMPLFKYVEWLDAQETEQNLILYQFRRDVLRLDQAYMDQFQIISQDEVEEEQEEEEEEKKSPEDQVLERASEPSEDSDQELKEEEREEEKEPETEATEPETYSDLA